ncbi:polysaccharide deacetylase [Schnuerera sp. xch1]|uniref:polysaccharide deacetylase family protein n=1 Tax=Schnuerera sp. xch1 TaxID=2874283 RepID=UPI001CBE3687|nr:polysaccharide deacetylase family protein [Schnuerera sp. xch1]MBZ2174501.1 polysaccharide deacetylase [Schnuerera sp. xch1]
MNKSKRIKTKKFNKRCFTVILLIIILFFTSYKYNEKMDSDIIEAEDANVGVEDQSSQSTVPEKEKELGEQKQQQNQGSREEIEQQADQEKKSMGNNKVAYLTFDDGPSETITSQILDILDEYDVKATFFVIGNLAERHPDMLKRIDENGHAIGNHTYTHKYNDIYKKPSNFIKELKTTEKIFKNILGEDFETKIMRFPGGSFGEGKAVYKEAVENMGYEYIDWNSLNGDAEGHNIPSNRLIERFKSTFKGQDELVVLMHDTDAKKTTPKALPGIIEFLIDNGYEFSTFE